MHRPRRIEFVVAAVLLAGWAVWNLLLGYMTRAAALLLLIGLLTYTFVAYYFLSGMAHDRADEGADNFGCVLLLFVPFLLYVAFRDVVE
jgi:uncharacterized membrane protein YphA (DoxX/SURF4 family)